MNKISINLKIPFAIQSPIIINPQNGYNYTKRITKEYKDLQQYCKDKSIFFNTKDEEGEKKDGELHYKSLWININPEYVEQGIINGLMTFVYKVFSTQTPTKHSFEN